MATTQEQADPRLAPLPSLEPPASTLESTPSKSQPCQLTSEGSDTSTSPPGSTASTLPSIPSDEDRSSGEEEMNRSPETEVALSLRSSVTERFPDHIPISAKETDSMNGTGSLDASKSRNRSRSSSTATKTAPDGVPRLSAADMQELTSSPDSLPVAAAPERRSIDQEQARSSSRQREAIRASILQQPEFQQPDLLYSNGEVFDSRDGQGRPLLARGSGKRSIPLPRPVSTPPTNRSVSSPDLHSAAQYPRRYSFNPAAARPPLTLNLEGTTGAAPPAISTGPPAVTSPQLPDPPVLRPPSPSPKPNPIPLPPMSFPTHLQLEIAAQRPSPLYIQPPHGSDIPYESSAVKFERLKNVLLIPAYLERTLYFGALACLDAWLYTFTILPIRFVLAVAVLVRWWGYVVGKEIKWVIGYVFNGLGRLLGRLRDRGRTGRRGQRGAHGERSRSRSTASEFSVDHDGPAALRERASRPRRGSRRSSASVRSASQQQGPGPRTGTFRHKRTKSMPSSLTAFHKADLLQGAVIICSSLALMTLDASRMYHFIRAQSTIKLYVIYNILEVGDRLLSALGQDILECLFSSETLSRNASGRSKVLLPLGMFALALAYNCLHSIALYYQVITLNVAVNSYSNALLTLLLSNQFVEIKSTVFKRFEKDNLFQLTCADIVERFHLWIMLTIIGMRNMVEVGGLSVPGAGLENLEDEKTGALPLHNSSILPHSFTVLPSWLMSGEVLSPFLIVIGSEMLVDAIKHAYVTKFNNIKPNFYSRILDILCKDYYTNAFMTPSLTRRLGLAVIPLSCLFIRASFQTYHMFLSTHLTMPMPPSTATSLAAESATPSSPAVIEALNRFDSLLRDSLGRATYGYPYGSPLNSRPWYSWTSDDFIAAMTMIVFFFIAFLVLLILKLLLGMALLKYSRRRYSKMKQAEAKIAAGQAERENYDAQGRRQGGFGHIEVGDDRQRWIHADKTEGLKGGKGSGGKRQGGDESKKPEGDYSGVYRYDMITKRIW